MITSLEEKRIIDINSQKVDYLLKRSKRPRSIRLAIYKDGSFIVTAPYFVDVNKIELCVIKKIDWVIKKINYFKNNPKIILSIDTKKDFVLYKEKAKVYVEERLKYFNPFYGFNWNRVTIKNTKSRWGSCSKKGNLNFNYKIILLPVHLADYIIVHELCHLKEMNHSSKFWSLIEKQIPDYKNYRKELRGIV